MRKRRLTAEQIIGLLKKAEAGMPVSERCRRHAFNDATICKWRAKHGGIQADETKRLRDMEAENIRLKKLLAEADRALCAHGPRLKATCPPA